MNELQKIDSFSYEVAIAETIDEIKMLSTKGEIMAEMARKLKIPIDGQNKLGRTRIELEKRKRELIEQMFPNGGKRGNQYKKVAESKKRILPDVGITLKESSDAKIIKEEEDLVEEVIKEIEESNEVITPKAVAARVRKKKKEDNYKKNKQEFEKPIKPENTNQIIIMGSCLDVIPTLTQTYDLLLTDPPYGMDFKSGWSDKGRIKHDKTDEAAELLNKTLELSVLKLKADAHFYIFGSIDYINIFQPIIEKHLILKNILIWDRGVIGMGDLKTYGNSYDIIYFGFKKDWKNLNGVRDRDILNFNRVAPNKGIHQTEKPTDLLEYLIKKSTNEGDNILDPFAGGGSTLVAAKNTNRLCTGIEIMEENYHLINSRI